MFVTEVNDRVQAVSDLIEIPVPPVASIEEARGKDIQMCIRDRPRTVY